MHATAMLIFDLLACVLKVIKRLFSLSRDRIIITIIIIFYQIPKIKIVAQVLTLVFTIVMKNQMLQHVYVFYIIRKLMKKKKEKK